jgi:hypothetical protein
MVPKKQDVHTNDDENQQSYVHVDDRTSRQNLTPLSLLPDLGTTAWSPDRRMPPTGVTEKDTRQRTAPDPKPAPRAAVEGVAGRASSRGTEARSSPSFSDENEAQPAVSVERRCRRDRSLPCRGVRTGTQEG